MVDLNAVVDAADRLHHQKDEVGLELLIGMRAKAIEQDPALRDDPDFEPKYQAQTMGPLDDIKALGSQILNRWNLELYGVVCGNMGYQKDRKAVLDSLNLGETAVVAAVAGALLSLGVTAAIAAGLAPLIVRRFIWPAKDELCDAWREALTAHS